MKSVAAPPAPPSPILPAGFRGGARPGRVLLPRSPAGGRLSPSLRSPAATTPRAEAADAAAFTAVEEDGFEASLYDLLGVPSSGSAGEIKKAYKQLARKYHPDVSPPERAEEYTRRFIEVQEAYETLSDPRRRAVYDRYMCSGFSGLRRAGEESMVRSNWRARWSDQIEELEKKSMNDNEETLSWGARMRKKTIMEEMNQYQN
ncbi:chaperone protein dnaJ 20, chloroplastic-like [Curcuma longa]|uniref:chaperone protein dnaJ 20, chloroplastic-like n=1 Tax=Curcuma longa TaxID=136217 RepID=UPI003D9E451E